MARPPRPRPTSAFARELGEAVRQACVDAALDGHERASLSGLCHEGAWEAAVSAIRMLGLDELAVHVDPETSADAPAIGVEGAAAATGAIAAGLLEASAALCARGGPADRRKRAHGIARRAAVLRSALGTREATPQASPAAADSALDVAARCAQVATLAAEIARSGHAATGPDAAAALRLAASAVECALALAEEQLRSAPDGDGARNAQRRIWRTRLVLQRARPPADGAGSA